MASEAGMAARKIKVLVVDDSAAMRTLLRTAIGRDSSTEIAGTASNGRIAVSMIPLCRPDVITLDIEMPEMNGLETLAQIRQQWPRLPVIMFSAATERGANETLDALAMGANDYLAKASGPGSFGATAERIRDQLITKIKGLCETPANLPAPPLELLAAAPSLPFSRERSRVDVVAIGTSTGGPNALADVLPFFPSDFPAPIVIVQHMPPIFTQFLAERLAARSKLQVREAVAGERLLPGCAWIAPGDYHLVIKREGASLRLATHQNPPENSCRPSVDVLFRSVSELFGKHSLAVVMTGMGQDGLLGAECIRNAGGQVIVQDESTSVVWGMPGFVARAGLADAVLPLPQIATEIVRRTMENRVKAAVQKN